MTMEVVVAKNAGFCKGVRRAFDMAVELVEKYGKIYTLGELVHNELVTEYLQQKGAICLDVKDEGKLKEGDVVLIRAHGIAKELEQRLRDRGVKLFDATCPVVKRNQKIAEERRLAGDDIIIVGDEKHDEVIGVASYAGDNVRVIKDDEELKIGEKIRRFCFKPPFYPINLPKSKKMQRIFKKTTAI